MPDNNHEDFSPGTYGCHESLHEASILANLLDSFSDNQAIIQNPEWKAMADQAAQHRIPVGAVKEIKFVEQQARDA